MKTHLPEIGMLAVDSPRSRAYLRYMGGARILPSIAIYLKGEGDLILSLQQKSMEELFTELSIPFISLKTLDPNDPRVLDTILPLCQKVWIYSGPGGAILKRPILESGKKFLHVHPGRLPEYRGSTTIYYSLLEGEGVSATAILLNEEIDAGQILTTADFPPPDNRESIDLVYDPQIRAEVIVSVMKAYADPSKNKREIAPQRKEGARGKGRVFYVIHPVLKHLAIISKTRVI